MITVLRRAWHLYCHRKIRRHALAWVLRFDKSEEQPIAESERARFDEWIADPQNQRAFEACWTDYSYIAAKLQEKSLHERGAHGRAERPSFRHALRLWVCGPVAATLLVFVGIRFMKYDEVVYATRTGESSHVILPDGSELRLSTRTKVRWEHCPSLRCVSLAAGEAYFSVRKDATRPFMVYVGVDDAAIRVIGTEFDVRRHQTEVDVTVAEGTVLVSAGENVRPWTRRLTANEQLTFNGAGIVTDVHHASAPAVTSWRDGALEINDSVPAVICRLSDYIDAPVTYDPRLADFGIQARLDLTNVPHTLMGLPTSAPIVVERIGDSYVVHLRTPPDYSGYTPIRCP